jgi:hypothetical protein
MFNCIDNDFWVKKNFGEADLGDTRRNKRLNMVASAMLKQPNQSIPKQMHNWNDTKAAYRLFSNVEVTHEKVQLSHREQTLKCASQYNRTPILFIQDSSELDYSQLTETEGIGPIGNHKGKGLMFHSCLAVKYSKTNPQVLGLPYQKVWEREQKTSRKKTETRSERNKRSKEADVWKETLQQLGPIPHACNWINIGDRGNDIFEFMYEATIRNWNFVIRAAQNRAIENEEDVYTLDKIRSLPSLGTTKVKLRKNNANATEEELKISFLELKVKPPERFKNKCEAITLWMIRCWNDAGIEWILYSSIPIKSIEDAIEKCSWYSCRWIIEEYHKCLKTGCAIEKRQLGSGRALKAILGVLGIIAIKLLDLKNLARTEPEILAKGLIPEIPIAIVCRKVGLKKESITIREFWRGVAQMGGFLGRRGDGEPGWQTLWKGWMDLLFLWEGAEMMQDIMKADLTKK